MTDGQPILGDPAVPPVHLEPTKDIIAPPWAPEEPPPTEQSPPRYTLAELGLYFLKLGTFGFGGPIALVGFMQRDLVERRKWVAKTDYAEGLALAQLAPGPLAAQLAIYLGWVRSGVLGATLVSLAFILPSFLMVLVLSGLYVRYGGLSWMQGAFYGIGASVIGVIARSAWKLVRATVGKDRLLAGILGANAAITAWTESEIIWVILLSGTLALLIKTPPRRRRAATLGFAPVPAWLLSGLFGPASVATLGTVFLYFAEAGAFVFGSGLAIVPFLHGGVVNHFRWLNEQQFLDAVAVAMITPGPVVITVAFIGYLVAGPLGAVVAALGVFLPCYLFVIVPAPYFRRIAANLQVKAFVDGVTAAATGAIAGAAIVLGRRAILDAPTALIAVTSLVILIWARRVPEPVLILGAGMIGLLISR
jgi:chromate transporter